jgi:Antitoxin VbhA
MASISEAEKLRRRQINESVIGTNAMEGLELDPETLTLMRRFEEGELTRQQLSEEIDLHVKKLLSQQSSTKRTRVAGAA